MTTEKGFATSEEAPNGLRLKGLFPIRYNNQIVGIVNFEGGLNSIKRDFKEDEALDAYYIGEKYFTVAVPIRDFKGEQIGLYLLGKKTSKITDSIFENRRSLIYTFIILSGMWAGIYALLIAFIYRFIVVPVKKNVVLLKDINQRVQSSSLEMLTGSQQVSKEVLNMNTITQEITNGIGEMAIGAEQVSIAVNKVNELNDENKSNIEALIKEIGKFKVD